MYFCFALVHVSDVWVDVDDADVILILTYFCFVQLHVSDVWVRQMERHLVHSLFGALLQKCSDLSFFSLLRLYMFNQKEFFTFFSIHILYITKKQQNKQTYSSSGNYPSFQRQLDVYTRCQCFAQRSKSKIKFLFNKELNIIFHIFIELEIESKSSNCFWSEV